MSNFKSGCAYACANKKEPTIAFKSKTVDFMLGNRQKYI